MNFPSQKPHRVSRRRLSRGQYAAADAITVNVMASGSTATIYFSASVQVKGPIPLAIPSRTAISQHVVNPQQATILFTAPIEGLPFTLATPTPTLTSATGAQIIGETGELVINPDNVLASAGGNYFPPSTADVRIGVQFGVANTGSTGSYNPPPAPTTNSNGVTNFHDGTYLIQFPVVIAATGAPNDPNITLWSPSANAWLPADAVAQNTPQSIIVTLNGGQTDCNFLLFQDSPISITASPPIKNAPALAF